MIRTRLLALAALAAPLAAAPLTASADPMLDAFRAVCVAHAGDYMSILKAADSTGWTNVAIAAPPTDANTSVTDKAALGTKLDGEDLTLLVNRGLQHMKTGDAPETTCRVESGKPHPTEIADASGWLGLKPDGGDGSSLAYFFVTGSADKLTHLATPNIPHEGMSLIKVQIDSSSAILIDQFFAGK